jgi:hypothetical protein
MSKKKQIIILKKKKKKLCLPYPASFWPVFLTKFVNLYYKKGKKISTERLFFSLAHYWKQNYSKDLSWDLVRVINSSTWPYILLKVKKHNKTVELPGVLKLEQRFFSSFKFLLKNFSTNLFTWSLIKIQQNPNINTKIKEVKQITLRNRRFLRYRW